MKFKLTLKLIALFSFCLISLNVAAISPVNCLVPPCVQADTPVPIPFTIVSEGLEDGIMYQQLHVLKDQAHLTSLLTQTVLYGAIPIVDFKTENLIAVFAGTNSGCTHTLSVKSVALKGSYIQITVKKTVSDFKLFCPEFIPTSRYYVIVKIPTSHQPVSLKMKVLIL